MNTFKKMLARHRALDRKKMIELGMNKAEMQKKRDSLAHWMRIWQNIPGAVWLNHTYDTKLLCIPLKEKYNVDENGQKTEIYALLDSEIQLTVDSNAFNVVENNTKILVKRLTSEEAEKASINFKVFFVPFTIQQNVQWRPANICDRF